MPDLKFSCPHCQQHIQAESGYAGMQINCPKCNGVLTVPASAVAVPPPPAALLIQGPTVGASPSACPSCGTALGRGIVLCTRCGFNLATGQRLAGGRPAPARKPSDSADGAVWYLTPYPYVGALVIVLGILYTLGKQNSALMLAFFGVGALYSLAIHLIVVVAAFKEGIGTGFLSLCIPFYALYFVFKVHENDTLKILYGVAVVLNLVTRFVKLD